jgi:hypothetical protein
MRVLLVTGFPSVPNAAEVKTLPASIDEQEAVSSKMIDNAPA